MEMTLSLVPTLCSLSTSIYVTIVIKLTPLFLVPSGLPSRTLTCTELRGH